MHPHPHTPITAEAPPSYYEIMEIAVRELLIEKQMIGPGEIRRQIEVLDSRTPALGCEDCCASLDRSRVQSQIARKRPARLRRTWHQLL